MSWRGFEALGYAAAADPQGWRTGLPGWEGSGERLAAGGAYGYPRQAWSSQIKSNGRLKITRIGGLRAENVETENCRVVTKFDGIVEGTAQLVNASVHVNTKYGDTQRTFDTIEIVLDEPVASAEDVKKLGIRTGDYVCFEPRTRVTESGYIKSRFLDDKLSVGILLGYASISRTRTSCRSAQSMSTSLRLKRSVTAEAQACPRA